MSLRLSLAVILAWGLLLPTSGAIAGKAKQPPRLGPGGSKEFSGGVKEFTVAGLRLGMTFKEVTQAVDKMQADKARAITKELVLPNGQSLEWVDSAQVSKVDADGGSIQLALKFASPASADSAESLSEIRFEEVQSKTPANGKYIRDLVAYATERYGQPSEEQVTYKCRIGSTGRLLGPADREPVAEVFDQVSLLFYPASAEGRSEGKKDPATLRVDLGLSCQRILSVVLADDRIRQDRDDALAAYVAQLRQDILRGEGPAKKPRF